ncbi:sigma-70 family RNA polymerase sigma factor, partial [Streptomyces cinereoruber]|uniref:hypothetical protein n=1 Tax=Streptomyces cinereoruber TaxID=67260 RepID=UPI0036404C66
MDRTPLPRPFAALSPHLEGDPSIHQAEVLSRALKAVPQLQKWLRQSRGRATREVLDGGLTAKEVAPHMNVSVQRVRDIASGHLNSASLARQEKTGKTSPVELPEPFAPLAHLTEGDASLAQLRALTQALTSMPDLQSWLRESRKHGTRALLDAGHTAEELAPHLGVGRQRVYDIAGGHQSSKDLARKVKAEVEAS